MTNKTIEQLVTERVLKDLKVGDNVYVLRNLPTPAHMINWHKALVAGMIGDDLSLITQFGKIVISASKAALQPFPYRLSEDEVYDWLVVNKVENRYQAVMASINEDDFSRIIQFSAKEFYLQAARTAMLLELKEIMEEKGVISHVDDVPF